MFYMPKKEMKKEPEKKLIIKSDEISHQLTFGQKAADWMTKWVGSWYFIFGIVIFLIIWMSINAYFLVQLETGNPFDPFPFILLNLVLSCIAALHAPVILMSQNRAAERDRKRFEYDYAIDRKSSREIEEIKKQLQRIEKKL